jgi:hypothetical protein
MSVRVLFREPDFFAFFAKISLVTDYKHFTPPAFYLTTPIPKTDKPKPKKQKRTQRRRDAKLTQSFSLRFLCAFAALRESFFN